MSVVNPVFGDAYRGKTVLVTGHTGFKGSWLCLWLRELGARVVGYSLPAAAEPHHFGLLDLDMKSVAGDLRDRGRLAGVVAEHRPDIVFHLAAQALVRRSYRDPVGTFESNVLGTVNLYEACRPLPEVRAIVTVTSDKAYENREWVWGYREGDPVGGHDPYSCSKGCAELVTACYRNCFFHPPHGSTLLASARAGNVIGGGDWAEDRLVPDVIRAAARGEAAVMRNPAAVRPWQHVLEPLSGYLQLGEALLRGREDCAEAWNFGPEEQGAVEVEAVVRRLQQTWPKIRYTIQRDPQGAHEAGILKLDSSKARFRLPWRPVWTWEEAVETTASWYRAFYEERRVTTRETLRQYVGDARARGRAWAN
jgi:CDP-glucose 4,6-dehydratase